MFDLDTSPLSYPSVHPGFAIDGDPIANGAYGVVYRARFQGNDVAAKASFYFLTPGLYRINSVESLNQLSPLKEIQRELVTLQSLQHHNIVSFRGVIKGKLFGVTIPKYILMDFVEGGTLENILTNQSRMVQASIMKISKQVSEALVYIHSRLLVHRDIKPDNIMVDERDAVKLTDFGLAKFSIGTSLLSAAGNYSYRAPEIDTPDPDYGTPADVYALGCVMLAMLTRSHPPGNHVLRNQAVDGLTGVDGMIQYLLQCSIKTKANQRPRAQDISHTLTHMFGLMLIAMIMTYSFNVIEPASLG